MESIYQMKSGRFLDLSQIISVSESSPVMFYGCGGEIMEVKHKEAFEVIVKFASPISFESIREINDRTDLIEAWKAFNKERELVSIFTELKPGYDYAYQEKITVI